jgi:hypothetical protein
MKLLDFDLLLSNVLKKVFNKHFSLKSDLKKSIPKDLSNNLLGKFSKKCLESFAATNSSEINESKHNNFSPE